MKQLIQKMAVMSVAFVLLCVNVIAQDENNIIFSARNSDGVTVNPYNVELKPNIAAEVTITLEQGYDLPLLIYEGEQYYIGDAVTGDFFIAILEGSKIIISLKNSVDLKNTLSDVIYVKAIKIEDDSTNTREVCGVPIIITYTPDSKQ